MWFDGIMTLSELHKTLVRLAKKHHPDVGGDVQIMKQINSEYDVCVKRIKTGAFTTDTHYRTYQSRKHTAYQSKKQRVNKEFLDELLDIARTKNYKIGWVAMVAVRYAQSYEDYLQIARACNYRDGWAYYRWREYQHKSV